MADISIIHEGNTDYNVKDAAGRLALVEVENKGAKNLIQNNCNSRTVHGVTATTNADGSITVSGASDYANDFLVLYDLYAGDSATSSFNSQLTLKPGTYINKGTGRSDVKLQIFEYNTSSDYSIVSAGDTDTTFTLTKSYFVARLWISKTASFSTPVTVYPMICTKSEWDISHAYVPYGKTNAELTNDTSTLFTENTCQQTEINYAINTGVKNLLPMTHTNGSITRYGVTCTWNDDGTMTLNGTHKSGDSSSIFEFYDGSAEATTILPAGSYVLTGCPAGGSTSTYRAALSQIAVAVDVGNGATFELSEPHYAAYRILISGNVTFNNMVFKPMIRPAAITDPTYEPYAPANRALYEEKIDHDLPVVSGSILDYADTLAPGIYFARQDSSTGSGKPVNNRRYVYNIYVYSSDTATIMAIEGEDPGNPRMFLTNKISGTWGSWYKFEGTKVT